MTDYKKAFVDTAPFIYFIVLKHSQTEFQPLQPWYHPHKEISAVLPVNPVSFSKQL